MRRSSCSAHRAVCNPCSLVLRGGEILLARSSRHSIDRIERDRRGRPIDTENVAPPAPEPLADPPASTPSRQSLRGLDWFIFFLADVQTGFGPFIAVYLTTQKWTQVEIGLVLSIGGIVALIGQMPGGAIIDAAKSERLVAGLAVANIGCCALAYAAMPIFPVVMAAATLHAAASCVLGPAIAAISLVSSGRLRSASGLAATPVLRRSAMVSPPP